MEKQQGGPNNSDVLQNWFPLLNLYKFENPERNSPESQKMHGNLINEEEFGTRKL